MRMLSGVVDGFNFAPLHLRKNSAVASRSSIRARWIPRQARDPAPKGVKVTLLCSGFEDWPDEIHLVWSNLSNISADLDFLAELLLACMDWGRRWDPGASCTPVS